MADGMSREQCFELLRRSSIGRIGITHDALPAIIPVPFELIEPHILFDGACAERAGINLGGMVASFQAEAVDTAGGPGWSVLATGVCHRVDSANVDEFDNLTVEHYGSPTWLQIELIKGYRL